MGSRELKKCMLLPPFQAYKEVIVHKLAESTSVPTPKLDSVSRGQTLSFFFYIHGTNVFLKRVFVPHISLCTMFTECLEGPEEGVGASEA